MRKYHVVIKIIFHHRQHLFYSVLYLHQSALSLFISILFFFFALFFNRHFFLLPHFLYKLVVNIIIIINVKGDDYANNALKNTTTYFTI